MVLWEVVPASRSERRGKARLESEKRQYNHMLVVYRLPLWTTRAQIRATEEPVQNHGDWTGVGNLGHALTLISLGGRTATFGC